VRNRRKPAVFGDRAVTDIGIRVVRARTQEKYKPAWYVWLGPVNQRSPSPENADAETPYRFRERVVTSGASRNAVCGHPPITLGCHHREIHEQKVVIGH
jgi:hypothetical protein